MDLNRKHILGDFFKVSFFRVVSKGLIGVRGLLIVLALTPKSLGEYTSWFLLCFYFSMLDLGTLSGLERDIPHFQGRGDLKKENELRNVGWSVYFWGPVS